MNLLVEKGMLTERICGSNFSYILQNDSDFSVTEYKVLQSQTAGNLVKCMKMRFNGKTELYYITGAYNSLSSILPRLDAERFMLVCAYLLAGIIDVKKNGFLTCNSIDDSPEHIYVDPDTFKVGLVYTPLYCHEYEDATGFENAIRARLIKIISDVPAVLTSRTMRFSSDLKNGKYSLEDVYARMGEKVVVDADLSARNHNNGKVDIQSETMKMISIGIYSGIQFEINNSEYFIGKKETNDGVIPFNKMISRVHCKIQLKEDGYYIQDLQSSNGTFVNDMRVRYGQSVQVRDGDMVRLANIDFRVEIR